jgi:hypothetical protein
MGGRLLSGSSRWVFSDDSERRHHGVLDHAPARRWQYRLNGSYSRQAILMPEASFRPIIQMLSLLLIET